MPIPSTTHQKMMSVYELLQEATISIDSFEHVHTILKGLHPKVDEKLEICSKALEKLQQLQSGDVITLSAEGLAEDTQEKRKRKKALLFFITTLKDLKSEIKRIDAEFTKANQNGHPSIQHQLTAWGRVVGFAKGPFGIVTFVALVIFGFLLLRGYKTQGTSVVATSAIISPTTTSKDSLTIQVITYNGKQIPLNQLYVGHGPDCDSPHYHATAGRVTALDGTVIPDPGNCAYGKLKNVQVTKVLITPSP